MTGTAAIRNAVAARVVTIGLMAGFSQTSSAAAEEKQLVIGSVGSPAERSGLGEDH